MAARLETLNKAQVKAYLERLNLGDDALTSAGSTALLLAISRQHVENIPFENLQPYFQCSMLLDTTALLQKITSGRGGFCFELNGVLASLLITLKYDVRLVSARIWRPAAAEYGPVHTHMLLLVKTVDGDGTSWLVDVANGSWLVEPVPLVDGALATRGQDGEAYQLVALRPGDTAADGSTVGASQDVLWRLYELLPEAPVHGVPPDADSPDHPPCPPGYERRLVFEMDTTPRQWAEFGDMFTFHSSSPESSFSKGLIVTSRLLGGTGGRRALVSGPWAGSAAGGVAQQFDTAAPKAVLWTRMHAGGTREEALLEGWPAIEEALWRHWALRLPRLLPKVGE
jgi:arylamine N-acetyltransferase